MKKFSYGKRTTKYAKRRVYRRRTSKFGTSDRSTTRSFQTSGRKNNEFFQRYGPQKAIGSFNTGVTPFPKVAYSTHRYAETFSLYTDNMTGLVGVTQTMRLNSLYDPNSTGLGHQPSGFDQMAYIYGRYVVYAANVNIRIHNADGVSGFLAMAVKPPQTSGSLWVMAGRKGDNLIETENCFVLDCTASGGGTEVQQWSSGWRTIGEWAGMNQAQIFNDIQYQGAYNSNPGSNVDFTIGAGSHGLEMGKRITFTITIDYKAQWFMRNAIEAS